MRKQPHLSASSIRAYLDCGLYYKFSRIDKLEKTFISDNLLFESTIHRVLAEYNQEKIVGSKMNLQKMYKLFEKYWKEAVDHTNLIKYSKKNSFESLLDQGKQMLRTYVSKVPEAEYKVIAVKKPFEFKIEGLDIPLIGMMELVEQDINETVVISDHKTMSSSATFSEIDQNFQLTLYYMAARRNGYAGREIVLKLDCLVKSKQPQFMQVYTFRSENHEKRAVKKIKEVYNAIQKEIFIPNAEGTWKCKNCEYKTYCDEWFLT